MNIIWVTPEGRKYCPNADQSNLGSIVMPLQSMQEAMNKIQYSSKKFWEVRVSPGVYEDSFTIPANKFICIIGTSRITLLGDCTWKLEGNLSSIVIFRDIGIGKLKIEDGNIPATLATMGLENISINEILKEGSSKLDIGIAGISAASELFANTLGAAGVVYGDINTDSYILCNNIGFLGGKTITCNNLKLQDCLIEQNIFINDKFSILKGTQWLGTKTSIIFTNSPGILEMDTVSYNSFIKNNIKLINGTIERI